MTRLLNEEFKSPMHKLAAHFKVARDGWRVKHHELQYKLKIARNQIRAVEKSRDEWRHRVEQVELQTREKLEEELATLRQEVVSLRQHLASEETKKKSRDC